MKSIAIIYHSGYGHTAKQAQAVLDGAKSVNGINTHLISVADVAQHWEVLNSADAIIFGSAVYMGSISAEFKKFMEESSKLWFTQAWKDKLAAGFVNSASFNGDKQTAIIQLATFAAQHGMLWVSLGLLPANSSKSERNDLNRMGASLGAFAQSDSDLGADVVPPLGDLATARYLGQRVAELTLRQK
ncbi:MAG: flavodoxin family protein [Burkholderiales bacterium]|jgi:NAD(P)H dehydrogenase (quinone)|nr:flavodoxin family protein [Burkholderiales bacterium]